MRKDRNFFNDYCEELRKKLRWMEFNDMTTMINLLHKSLDDDQNFILNIDEYSGITIITNKQNGERSVILDPRMVGESFEKTSKIQLKL